MFLSEHFGRAFWIDDNSNDFTSCPLKVNNEPDFDYIDYVSEWEDSVSYTHLTLPTKA